MSIYSHVPAGFKGSEKSKFFPTEVTPQKMELAGVAISALTQRIKNTDPSKKESF